MWVYLLKVTAVCSDLFSDQMAGGSDFTNSDDQLQRILNAATAGEI